MSEGFFNAIKNYKVRRIKSLINNGVSLKVHNSEGKSPLVVALHIDDDIRRQHMFRYLARHGAECSAYDPETKRDVFTWCCFLDRTSEALFTMADQNGNIDFQRRDHSGRTALHYTTVNGNIVLLKTMVDYMKKYFIAVDIPDEEGFTPYILARRMGHTEAADILASAGASDQRMDSKNFRSVKEWSWIREREKSFFLHKTDNRKLGMYKVLGRLPAIKAARFKSDKIKIVESKVDKNLLKAQKENIEDSSQNKSSKLYKQKTWLDFNKLKEKHLTRSMPELKDLKRDQTKLEPLPNLRHRYYKSNNQPV